MTETGRDRPIGEPPPVGPASTLDDIAHALGDLRDEAGAPSYTEIVRRITALRTERGDPVYERQPGRVTVYECFRPHRRRMDTRLVMDIVRALGCDETQATAWRRTCQAIQHQVDATSVVSVRTGLPKPVDPFVGRKDEVDAVVAAFDPQCTTVVLLTGMPGVGKTQTAVRAGAILRDAGDVDTVVVAELRGHHADLPPADPAAVRDTIVRLLDPGRSSVPDDRSLAYHAAFRTRRTLLVLDDAASIQQVNTLLPQGASALVVVTSRLELGHDDATTIRLREFTEDEAVTLIERIVGKRATADPVATAEVAASAGRLPLALGLTAARIANRPDWSMSDHVAALRARREHLHLDPPVQATLDLSYQALTPEARRLLRLIAIQPAADLGLHGVAALADRDAETVSATVAELERASLVGSHCSGRIGLHDLIVAYASARSLHDDSPSDRDAALDRLFDHYLAVAGGGYFADVGPRGVADGRVRRPARTRHALLVPTSARRRGHAGQ